MIRCNRQSLSRPNILSIRVIGHCSNKVVIVAPYSAKTHNVPRSIVFAVVIDPGEAHFSVCPLCRAARATAPTSGALAVLGPPQTNGTSSLRSPTHFGMEALGSLRLIPSPRHQGSRHFNFARIADLDHPPIGRWWGLSVVEYSQSGRLRGAVPKHGCTSPLC